MRPFVLLAAFLVLLSFAAAQKTENPTSSTPSKPATDYSKEAYVVEHWNTSYRFENDGTGTRDFYVRVKIQSEAGVQAFGQIVLGYSSANEKVDIPYVRVLKADGSTVTAPADAVQDLSTPVTKEAPVYTDYRQKHITVPGLRPGETLEYDVKTTTHTALAPGQFWMNHDFSKFGIILDEQLTVDIPANRQVKVKSKKGMDPQVTEANGRRVYRWTSSYLEREEDKEKSEKDKKKPKPSSEPEPPAVQMTTFSSWEEVGRWYAALEKEKWGADDKIRAKASELTAGRNKDLDKIEGLYSFVAKDFRYVSLSFGVGRYQPHAASEIFQNQYGDCKDKHTLLASLLKVAGFQPSTVLINSSRKLDPDIPSPSQFDHVITMVPTPSGEIWMDTTPEVAPFRLLSYNIRKKQALVIPAEGVPHLEETPADPPTPDTDTQEIDAKISDSGKLEGKVHLSAQGDTELVLRSIFRHVPASKWKQLVESISGYSGLSGDVDDLQATDPAATGKPFEMNFKITDSDYLDWTKKKLSISLPFSQMSLPDVQDEDPPSPDPAKLGPAGEHIYRIRFELPTKYSVRVPVSFSVKREFGEYQATYHLEGAVFTAERRLVSRISEVPADRAAAYRSFRSAVLADLSQGLSLESTLAGNPTPPDLKPDELNQKGLDALNNGNATLAIELLKRVVEAEPKHKTAWNNLGLAYLNNGLNDDAIAAFKKQVEINPYDEYAYNNEGRVYRIQRKFPEAEAAFRKQLEVNPLDKYTHANLGELYNEWHKYSEAAPELETAISLTPDNPALQIYLGNAQLNLGNDDKAVLAFNKAVELSATPVVWNDIAYNLSLKKSHLDLALQYAESSVTSTAALSRNLTLDHPTLGHIYVANALSAYWDTLGWVYFAKGDLGNAEKYVWAAWVLAGHGEVGDHLAQIYEKRGQKQDAIRMYAQAASGVQAIAETRGRLAALVGSADRVDAEVEKNKDALQKLRTFSLGKVAKLTGSADFLILLSSENPLGAEDVKFISGEEKLKDFTAALKQVNYKPLFPDNRAAKIVRRGTLACSTATGNCEVVLLLPSDVHSVE